jgi:hypothetical protein
VRSPLANSRSGVIGCFARASFSANSMSSALPATTAASVRRSVQPTWVERTMP